MKNLLLPTLTLLLAFFTANDTYAQELFRANFETFDSTPYYFRFGNKGAKGEYNYKPRWMYSHEVIENPYKNTANPSDYVLEYTTMEARNYGLKIRFGTPISLDELQTISFRVYQPANVIGKEVESAYSNLPATQQNICVKILSYFNSINDFNQDEGILMYKSTQSFTQENEWIEVNMTFNKNDYASQLGKFTKGVLGIAILPTYDADVTLKEEGRYSCYIDDIVINKSTSSIGEMLSSTFTASYSDGKLYLCVEETGDCKLSICDMTGKNIDETTLYLNGTNTTLPLTLNQGIYIVKCEINHRIYQTKIVAL